MSSIPESHRDLLEAQVATLATVGPDGRPQLSEVWFLAEGEDVRLSLNTSRQKVNNLQRNPADVTYQHDGQHETDDQQQINGSRTFGGSHILGDKVGAAAQRHCRHDGRRKDSDAVGRDVLQKPRHRSEDGPPDVTLREERRER